MNKIENLLSRGRLSIVITDQYGRIKEKREIDNLVVNAGLAYIISRMVGVAKNVMSHMAVGSGTSPAAAGAAITEAGIFNAASSGDMLCRTVFAVLNKAAADSMVITWTITLSAV